MAHPIADDDCGAAFGAVAHAGRSVASTATDFEEADDGGSEALAETASGASGSGLSASPPRRRRQRQRRRRRHRQELILRATDFEEADADDGCSETLAVSTASGATDDAARHSVQPAGHSSQGPDDAPTLFEFCWELDAKRLPRRGQLLLSPPFRPIEGKEGLHILLEGAGESASAASRFRLGVKSDTPDMGRVGLRLSVGAAESRRVHDFAELAVCRQPGGEPEWDLRPAGGKGLVTIHVAILPAI